MNSPNKLVDSRSEYFTGAPTLTELIEEAQRIEFLALGNDRQERLIKLNNSIGEAMFDYVSADTEAFFQPYPHSVEHVPIQTTLQGNLLGFLH